MCIYHVYKVHILSQKQYTQAHVNTVNTLTSQLTKHVLCGKYCLLMDVTSEPTQSFTTDCFYTRHEIMCYLMWLSFCGVHVANPDR